MVSNQRVEDEIIWELSTLCLSFRHRVHFEKSNFRGILENSSVFSSSSVEFGADWTKLAGMNYGQRVR
jgi:hypothetical protein